MLLGLDKLVQLARDDASITWFHLHGWERCNSDVRFYCCVAAMSSYAMEDVLSIMMADDRVARQLTEITDGLKEELQRLEALPCSVWSRLADALGGSCTSHMLRNYSLSAAHTACAYFSRQSLWQYLRDPWQLCRGDIQGNFALCWRGARGLQTSLPIASSRSCKQAGV